MRRCSAEARSLSAVLERAELHLIHRRRNCGRGYHLVQLSKVKVRHPYGACVSLLVRSLHSSPGPGWTTLRPVNQVEVDEVDAEPLETPLSLDNRVLGAGPELRGDEDFISR